MAWGSPIRAASASQATWACGWRSRRQFGPLGPEKGATAPLVDKGETIGVALRTRERVSPVFISPGHRIDLASAVAVTLAATTRFRLPEPIRFAHAAAGTL